MNPSDEGLTTRFSHQGKSHSSSKLVQRYEKHIADKCYYYLKDGDDVKDVSQEVFVRLHTKAYTDALERATNGAFACWSIKR